MVIIMNKMKLLPIFGVFVIVMSNPVIAFAHVALAGSIPKADTTVNMAPESLMLEFTEDVRLLKVSMTPKDSEELDIDFKPVAAAATHFNVALPSLQEGEYQVSWTVMGSDGHRMDESFNFTIDANAEHTGHDAGHGAHDDSHNGHSDGHR